MSRQGDSPKTDIEVIINLWYVIEPEGEVILRLAGRAYAAVGSDQDKIALLKRLAPTDYAVAQWFPVPKRFVWHSPAGKLEGVAWPEVAKNFRAELFEEVFQGLEAELPEMPVFIGGRRQPSKLTIPPNPLFVVTPLRDDGHGGLQSMIDMTVQLPPIVVEILPQLRMLYGEALQPHITSVKIGCQPHRCFLEIVTERNADEMITRTDLGFISDGPDDLFFDPLYGATENARKFVEKFAPASIANCTDLFTEEAGNAFISVDLE